MSASNHNYVCFGCRTAIRHPKMAPEAPRCKECGIKCFCLGYKVEIPKRDDMRSWRLLQAECERRQTASLSSMEVGAVRRQHALEKEIQRLKDKPENPNRTRDIKMHVRELEQLLEKQAETDRRLSL